MIDICGCKCRRRCSVQNINLSRCITATGVPGHDQQPPKTPGNWCCTRPSRSTYIPTDSRRESWSDSVGFPSFRSHFVITVMIWYADFSGWYFDLFCLESLQPRFDNPRRLRISGGYSSGSHNWSCLLDYMVVCGWGVTWNFLLWM